MGSSYEREPSVICTKSKNKISYKTRGSVFRSVRDALIQTNQIALTIIGYQYNFNGNTELVQKFRVKTEIYLPSLNFRES